MQNEHLTETICPACKSNEVAKGSLIASDEDEKFSGRFYPEGLKFPSLRRSVPISYAQGFVACTNCGHLWNKVDVAQLQNVLNNIQTSESAFAPGTSYRAKWGLLIILGLVIIAIVSWLRSIL